MHESDERDSPSQFPLQASLVVYGEVLYDCFPDGKQVLGGAPFNVAWALKGFGQDPLFVSSIGADGYAAEIHQQMESWGLCTESLQQDATLPTGQVQVTINNNEPSYDILMPSAWDAVKDVGVVATDLLYHGSLALRSATSRETLRAIMERSPGKRFFDVNLRPPHYVISELKEWVHGADWLKLNIDELRELTGAAKVDFLSATAEVDELRERYSVGNVLLTGGGEGALIRGEAGSALLYPAPQAEPFIDTVGAGDSFTAVTIDGILKQEALSEIVQRAGRFAARVCGIAGATTQQVEFYKH